MEGPQGRAGMEQIEMRNPVRAQNRSDWSPLGCKDHLGKYKESEEQGQE